MKKLGITTQLFLAFLALIVLVTLAMGLAARVSFTRGFLGYLNEQGLERVEQLLPAVTQAYRTHRNWDFVRERPRAWFEILRPGPRPPADSEAPREIPEPDLIGVNLRLGLLDAERKVIIGPPRISDFSAAAMRPIVVDERTVGYLAILPFQQATPGAAQRFLEGQVNATWAIGAVSIALAAMVAMVLARLLFAPLKRIAAATHSLAAGDYATRVSIDARDEIGRLGEDFNRLAVTLEKNEQVRRGMMADVSHELLTPLAILSGELDAIEDGVRGFSPATLRSLQVEVDGLSQLVRDLHDLSLSDLGALTYRMTDCDVAEILHAALHAFGSRFAELNIALETQLPDAPVMTLADEGRLRQLFNNLLENMLRYTDRDGTARIVCRVDGERIVVEFQDSKPGVPDELLPRLFERLYRVESSRNRAKGGAGLGLAICKNIVEAHQGRLSASHSPLGGLCITVELPATPTA